MADQLPEFEAKTNQPLGVQMPDIQGITGKMALNETALGQIGAKIGQIGGNAIAMKMGYEMGQTPQGDLLPAITESDQAFEKAYTAQASATLGIQAHRMMLEGQTELANKPKITQDDISEFETNMAQGLDSIVQQAPTPIKSDLQSQFSNQLLQASGNLTTRKIKQDREEQIDTFNQSAATNQSNLYSAAMSGNNAYADSIEKNFNNNIQSYVDSKLITRQRGDALKKGMKISKWSGRLSNESAKARSENNLAEYLSTIDDKKPDDLSFDEWDKVKTNVLQYNKTIDQEKSLQKNKLISGAKREAVETGTVSPETLEKVQNDPSVSEADYNNLLVSLAAKSNRQSTRQEKINAVIEDFTTRGSPAFNNATEDQQNEAFLAVVNAESDGTNDFDTMTKVAQTAAGPISLYNKILKNKLNSPNGEDVLQATRAIDELNRTNSSDKLQLTKNDYALNTEFNRALESTGDAQEANKRAREIVLNQSDEDRQIIASQWAQIQRDRYSTPSQKASLRKSLFNAGMFTNFTDAEAMNDYALRVFGQFMQSHRNDETAAMESAKMAVDKIAGDSQVNGANQKMLFPPEKMAKIGEDGAGAVQADIINSVKPQFALTKQAYDEGKSQFYYRFKNPEMLNIDAITQEYTAVNDIANKLGQNGIEKLPVDERRAFIKRLRQSESNLNAVLKGGAVEVEKVFSEDNKQDLKLNILPGNLMVHEPKANTIGSYQIMLQDKNHKPVALHGVGVNNQNITYNMDKTKVQNNYSKIKVAQMNGFSPLNTALNKYVGDKRTQEQIAEDAIQKAERREKQNDKDITSTFLF